MKSGCCGLPFVLAILLAPCAAGSLFASDIAWTGMGDGSSWNDAANWTPATCPGAGDVAWFTNGVGETTVDLPNPVTLDRMRFDYGAWRFTGAKLTLTNKSPFPWGATSTKPREMTTFENAVEFSSTEAKTIYGGKVYRGAVTCGAPGRAFFSRQYGNKMDDAGSVVRYVAFSGPGCVADFSGLDSVAAGANKSDVRDGIELEISDGASVKAGYFFNFPGTHTVITNATLSLTSTGSSLDQLRASSLRVCAGGAIVAAGKVSLGQNKTSTDAATFVVNRGTVKAGLFVQDGNSFDSMVENGGTVWSEGDVRLEKGVFRVTDGRIIAGGRLTIGPAARLVLDPVRASIGAAEAPQFSDGAKIALDAAYAECVSGRFLLTSWESGTLSGNLETLFDTTSARGRAPRLSVETEEGRGYLWLDLDRNAEYPTVRVMAIGDSITEGKNPVSDSKGPYGNWRMTCWKALAAAGYDVVATGWRDRYPEDHANRTMPLRWRSHAGISGQYLRTADGRAGHLESIGPELDQAGDVDVVLMMIGTNDIERNAKADDLLVAWTNLVGRIVAARPAARIVCGTIVDRTDVVSAKNRRQTIRDFNAGMHALVTMPGVFPANQVSISENYDAVPLDLYYNTLHPDWPGMIRLGCAFAEAAKRALVGPGPAAAPQAVTTTCGSAANVPEAYRRGFRLARTLRPAATTHYLSGASAYDLDGRDPQAVTNGIGRVGYYIELRRKNTATTDYHGHVRWLWADMEAFGDGTLEAVGFPFADGTRQEKVRRLHVVSNEPLIGAVPPDDDAQEGWIQFSPHNCSEAASGLAGAPADFYHYDWNDTFGTGYYGAFQLARLLPGRQPEATMLFAYNRWARRNDAGATEVVLGDFAQRISSTTSNWSLNGILTSGFATMDAGAYEAILIEIHTRPRDGFSVNVH